MDRLPLHLLDDILFRLEPKSLATMRCINISIRSHISDPEFESDYFSSSLFHLSSYGAYYVYCLPLVSSCISKSPGKEVYFTTDQCYIFGSCSGLLLLYVDGLFVVNPLTKRFRILDHSGSKLLPEIVDCGKKHSRIDRKGHLACTERAMCVGFAVNRYSTTKRFKIVCILEMHMMYRFEISDGDSWRLSDTTITASSKSDLIKRMKPVYLNGTLHWLRNDGSVIAFNPETELARFIPSQFHREPNTNLYLAADEKINHLALISGTEESISVYTLLKNSKWSLVKQMKSISMEESELKCCNVVAYDGKRLVMREKKGFGLEGVVHVYDMEANSWGVLGSTTPWSSRVRDFYKFTPSLLSIDENEQNTVVNDKHRSYLTAIMRLIDTDK